MTNYKKINEINDFEDLLKKYFQNNPKSEFADIKYSQKELHDIKDKINLALKFRKLKNKAGNINFDNSTFSQYLYNLRIKSKFDQNDMNNILGIGVSLIDDLESGRKRIDSLSETIIANILSKLNITINRYIHMLKNELKANAGKNKSLEAFARSKSTLSHDDRSKKMQHGIDTVMLEILKRKNNFNQIEIDQNHIDKVKKHLIKLGEADLLK